MFGSVDRERVPSAVALDQRDAGRAAVSQNQRPGPFSNAPCSIGGGDSLANHVDGRFSPFAMITASGRKEC
jgi:hypothetical protein